MTGKAPRSFEKVFATALSAPLGLGAKLVDELPTNITRAKQQLDFARFLGKMAVDRGVAELTAKLRDTSTELSSATVDTSTVAHEIADDIEDVTSGVSDIDADDLALIDYDQLAASHVISKLAGLTDEEVTEIEHYELAHRGRRTVLGKIDQIRSDRA